MRIHLDIFRRFAQHHDEGYLEYVLSVASVVDGDTVTISKEALDSVRKKFPRRIAVPFDQWPRYAKRLARRAKPEDRGVGDVVRRLAARGGGEVFKRAFKKIVGRDCGCKRRQERLNAMYPFSG